MFSNGFFIILFSFFLTSSVYSEVSSPSAGTENTEVNDVFFICKRDKSIRWLRAYRLDTGKCKSLYSKEGYLQVISSATYFSSCEGVLMSVKKNLEEGGFKCIQQPKVSFIELETE